MPFYLEIMGDIYRAERNYHAAIVSYFKALGYAKELDDYNNVAICLGFIGSYYLDYAKDTVVYRPDSLIPPSKMLALQKAIDFMDSAITLSSKIGFMEGIQDFSEHLSEAYEATGNYKKAIELYKLHAATKDSVFSVESKVKIAKLETQREIELKDK